MENQNTPIGAFAFGEFSRVIKSSGLEELEWPLEKADHQHNLQKFTSARTKLNSNKYIFMPLFPHTRRT